MGAGWAFVSDACGRDLPCKLRRRMTTFLTLAEAAKFIPGADANTLKRMCRAGKLTCYRPGKAYLTTAADVQEAIQSCRVAPKVPTCGYTPPVTTAPVPLPMPPLGLSSTEIAEAALDSALAQVKLKKTKR